MPKEYALTIHREKKIERHFDDKVLYIYSKVEKKTQICLTTVFGFWNNNFWNVQYFSSS